MITQYILLVFGVCAFLGALFSLIRPYFPAALPAFLGLCFFHWSRFIAIPDTTFIFWGAASFLLLAIHSLSAREHIEFETSSSIYLSIGAFAGLLIGMTISASFMILGTAFGTILATVAFVNTPKGRSSKFRSSSFIHYFCTKGLQVIVTIAMLGIAIEGFILNKL